MLLTIQTEVVKDANGGVLDLVFYLADVEAFEEPTIVVPDIGGPHNQYLQVLSRRDWGDLFEYWLEQPHHDDHISVQEEESVADEDTGQSEDEAHEEEEGSDEGSDEDDEEDDSTNDSGDEEEFDADTDDNDPGDTDDDEDEESDSDE